MPNLRTALLGVLLSAAYLSSQSLAETITQTDILNDEATTDDVLTYGMGTKGQRYSPLTQIDTSNAGRLVPVWSFSFGGEKQRGQEAQPLVTSEGRMFVTASYSRVFAIDVRTGKKLWQYEHRLPGDLLACCDMVSRGLAIYGDLVIFGTLDAQLIALNQATGKVVWKEAMADYKAGYSYTAAPVIVKNLVVTGIAGGEFGVVGHVDARDAATGKLVWTRPTVEGHMGYLNGKEHGITGVLNATWSGDLWQTGGAAPWLSATYDPELNLIYFGTGQPAPWNSYTRLGDNLYSCSTLAIDADTGKITWHYQNTPHDSWDYDGANEFVAFDYKDKNGQTVKAGAKADRNGFFYVNDRANGKLLNAFKFVQTNWATGIDLKTGRPNFDDNFRPGDPALSADKAKGKTVFAIPSFQGGKNHQEMAYSKDTGLFYVGANEWGMELWNEPITYKKGAAYLGAGFTIKTIHDDYIGAMRAINPVTGKIEWETRDELPMMGGGLVTKGDVLFYGTADGHFKAVNAKNGKELWKFQTGSTIMAPPITWSMDGDQYVAVLSGYGGALPMWGGDAAKKLANINQGGSVWVFRLFK